jgi:hypothetical protein
VRFPHLLWAIENWGPHYRLAQAIGRSEARLSRCLSGRANFSSEERFAIASILGFPQEWLFEEAMPPDKKLFAETVDVRT